jgi:lauroyl/myristoyl acyltransferase
MSLSSHLQSREFLQSLPEMPRDKLRDYIFSRGCAWFDSHQEDSDTIRKNCACLGMNCDSGVVREIQHHILLHYFEKFLLFSMTPQQVHSYLTQRVALPDDIAILKKSLAKKTGVLVAVCHFGAVELIGPSLAAAGIPCTGTLRFATGMLSEATRQKALQLAQSGLFADIRFIEIGAGPGAASLEMAAVLRRGGLLLAVFDEPTPYNIEVTLGGHRIMGGAGIDRLAAFMNNNLTVVSACMIRTGDETYKLLLSEHDGSNGGLIQSLYGHFERVCLPLFPQWYFLHEEIPFVK